MRGCAGVVLLGVLAGGCATGSDALPDGDSANDVEAGDDAARWTQEASIDPNGHDGSASLDGAPGTSGDDGAAEDAFPPVDGSPLGDDDAGFDATGPVLDASDASVVSDVSVGNPNLGPLGIGYTWQSMTTATANTGRLACPVVNDNSSSTQVNIDSNTGDNSNAWEAAGVIFANAQSVSSVTFVQGTTGTASAGDGWFEAGFAVQLSTDGTTWSNAAWSATPAYAYSSAVSGKTYVFSGAPVSGVVGVRVVGQVNTVGKSWWEAAKEVMVFAP